MPLDDNDRKLLNLLQTEFPFTPEPYADLGQCLGVSGDEIIRRIRQLKEDGIIRMIGPVIDSRSLGFQSTLVAMKVHDAGLEKAGLVIAAHPGISHGYQREHQFNVWITLAMPEGSNIEEELEELKAATGAEAAFSLPALKVFKIGAYFDMDENGGRSLSSNRGAAPARKVELSATDRIIINELQQDLPLVSEPFTAMAESAGMEMGPFLEGCHSLRERGVIRRYSASINHRNAGFIANAMTCWKVPDNRVEAFGTKLASLKEVSHCYERKTDPLWQRNLFAMVHGRSREACQEIVDKVSREAGLADYALLYSTKEFKKTRVKYLV